MKKLNLFTLVFPRAHGDMIVYKIISEIYDRDAAPVLQCVDTKNQPSTHRNSLRIGVRRAEGGHDLKHNFFTLRVAKIWNKLPDDVVTAPTVGAFKRCLD